MKHNIKAVSWNVNGLNNPVKRSKVLAKLKREKNQIVFLQETHLNQTEHEKLKSFGFQNTFYSSYKRGHKRRVAILLHNSINFELVKEIREGRYILVHGRIENELVTLFSVYLPPQSDPKLLRKVMQLIVAESAGVLICAGDFNTVIDKRDTSNNKRTVTPQNKILRKGLDEIGLLDIWRVLHPTERDYTFYSAPHKVYSRIDIFFIPKNDRHRI